MADTPARVRRKHRSLPRLLGGQAAYQIKLIARSPLGAFVTFVIPLMLLVILNLLNSSRTIATRGDMRFAQFFTPAIAAFAVVNACYINTITSTTLARELGILKRLRGTPLPPGAYMAGRIASAAVLAVLSAVAVVLVGTLFYDVTMQWRLVPGAILTLALGIITFCGLGLAVTNLVPAADTALPVAYGTILPLAFISDVFFPIETSPHWLQTLASAFPLRPLARSLEAAFDPRTVGWGLRWHDIVVLAAWAAGSMFVALRFFRWEPRRRGRRRGGGHHRERKGRLAPAGA